MIKLENLMMICRIIPSSYFSKAFQISPKTTPVTFEEKSIGSREGALMWFTKAF